MTSTTNDRPNSSSSKQRESAHTHTHAHAGAHKFLQLMRCKWVRARTREQCAVSTGLLGLLAVRVQNAYAQLTRTRSHSYTQLSMCSMICTSICGRAGERAHSRCQHSTTCWSISSQAKPLQHLRINARNASNPPASTSAEPANFGHVNAGRKLQLGCAVDSVEKRKLKVVAASLCVCASNAGY